MLRKLSSSIVPPQYRSELIILKLFIFIVSGQIDLLRWFLLASISSAFGTHSWVFCWMALLSISHCSTNIFHMDTISDCMVGSCSLGLLPRTSSRLSPTPLLRWSAMSAVFPWSLWSFLLCVSSGGSMECHRVKIRVTQPRGDRRFSLLQCVLAKPNWPLAAILGGIVDDWR